MRLFRRLRLMAATFYALAAGTTIYIMVNRLRDVGFSSTVGSLHPPTKLVYVAMVALYALSGLVVSRMAHNLYCRLRLESKARHPSGTKLAGWTGI